MIKLITARNINLLSGIIGAIASVLLSIAVVVLVDQNSDQAKELSCRSELATETDVLRSEVTIALSEGLIAITEEDNEKVLLVISHLHDLQDQLADAAARRAMTMEICE